MGFNFHFLIFWPQNSERSSSFVELNAFLLTAKGKYDTIKETIDYLRKTKMIRGILE